jgi:hypothetical protein
MKTAIAGVIYDAILLTTARVTIGLFMSDACDLKARVKNTHADVRRLAITDRSHRPAGIAICPEGSILVGRRMIETARKIRIKKEKRRTYCQSLFVYCLRPFQATPNVLNGCIPQPPCYVIPVTVAYMQI